jgi:hypothetical protein
VTQPLVSFGSLPKKSILVAGTAVAYVALCLFAMAAALRSQESVRLVLAVALPVAPFAFVTALRAPLIFPFTLYLAFIPFENLSESGPLGTIAMLLGIVSTCAVLAHLLVAKQIRVPGAAVAAWGLWIMLIAASTTWAIDQSVAVDFLTRYLRLYLLLVVVAFIPVKWSDLRAVLIASVFGGVCAALYGGFLFLHAVNVSQDERIFVQVGDHVIDPNHFAAALLVPLAIALIVFLRLRFGPAKLAMLVVLCAIASGFVTSGSRGGLMATGAMLVYLIIRSRYRAQLLVIAAIGAVTVSSSSVSERFARALSSGGAGRLSIWKTAYAAFRKAWLLGSGTGNFQEAYDRSWFDVYHGTYLHWHIVAHNLIAQTAVELGGAGLVLTLFAWWVQFRSLKSIKPSSPYSDLRIALEAATLSLFVSSLFLDIMWYKYTWELFILAALTRQFMRAPWAETTANVAPASDVPMPLRVRSTAAQ